MSAAAIESEKETHLVRLGGKGSTLSSSSVFQVSNGLARFSIDSSVLSRLSSLSGSDFSTSASAAKFSLSIPDYFTSEEARASLLLLLNKLLLSSSPSVAAAATQLSDILLTNFVRDSVQEINAVSPNDIPLFDYSVAALVGVSALLDHCSSVLVVIADAVAALSCEALRADVSAINLMDSGDGSSAKDDIAVAADFKVFFTGSKLVSGKLFDPAVSNIPAVHGNFREICRLLHYRTRVQLSSGFKAGTAEAMSTILSSLAVALFNLAELSFRRAKLLVEKIPDELRAVFDAQCPSSCGCLEELYISSQESLKKKEYVKFSHEVYSLLDAVRKIVSWEATAAFVTLEGCALIENIQSGAADKKSEKRKKVLGKGCTALMQFIKESLLIGESMKTEQINTSAPLEKWMKDFLLFLDPRESGFESLLKKVKEIVESNESRRLPKLPKVCKYFIESRRIPNVVKPFLISLH